MQIQKPEANNPSSAKRQPRGISHNPEAGAGGWGGGNLRCPVKLLGNKLVTLITSLILHVITYVPRSNGTAYVYS